MTCSTKKIGFTILEMSLVLVIISLIIGGIMFGRSMIRSAELVAIGSEYTQYTQAINQFRAKYNALPGDFNGAEALWGQAAATPADCLTTSGGNNETCNGNGDGRVVSVGTNYDTTAYEQFRAWQHLGNAQMIDGNYTGLQGASGKYDRTPGKNIPASKVSGAGWAFITITTYDISSGEANVAVGQPAIQYSAGDIKPNNLLWLGGGYIGDTLRMTPILTGAEALALDQKLDDGKPLTGKIVTQNNSGLSPQCVSSSAYVTTGETLVCTLVFKTDL